MSRHFPENHAATSICLGEYFDALQSFFKNEGCKILCRALAGSLQQDIRSQDIGEIRIILEKHGEFYHPARLEAFCRHQKASFVLNVAVSETGIEAIQNEYHCLAKLNDEFPLQFLPEVYGIGEVKTEGQRKIRLFLGQWFEGYSEFHITRDPSGQTNKILVWDDLQHRYYLSWEQSADLYRRAAGILTYYYNIASFEQISSWHHGAGDFIVKIDRSDLDVKLITVRGYGSLFKNLSDLNSGEKDAELILQALLVFLLKLSIQMRLDRLDGVGGIIWADRLAVKATLDGFFESLAQKPRVAVLPDSIDRCFRYYLSICTAEDLFDLSNAVIKTFNQKAPEVWVVKRHLKEHVEELSRIIADVVKR